ncbi:MAG: heme ABC transporter ATP-binding protein [Gammaproteobacteria bacterium]
MSYVAHELGFRAGGRMLLDGVSLTIEPGQVHALLGPNGAGKTTLLKLLAGERPPASGSIELNRRALAGVDAGDLARQRAVLPQAHGLSFAFTGAQVVSLGRLPCARHSDAGEARIVREALELAGVGHLADRSYPTLSGGERARVQFARAVAQVWDPLADGAARFLLLDEPTASLDLAHQHDCLRSVRTLAGRGLGVLVILHDPNLALRYATRATLLREGRTLASGAPADVLTADTIGELYGVQVRLVRANGDLPVVTVHDAR